MPGGEEGERGRECERQRERERERSEVEEKQWRTPYEDSENHPESSPIRKLTGHA